MGTAEAHQWPRRCAVSTAALVCLAGSLVVVAWAFDIVALQHVVAGWPRMAAGTALGFAVAGASLFLVATRGADSRLAAGLAGTVLLLGLFKLGEHLTGWRSGIDSLWFHDTAAASGAVAPARMSPATALELVMLGAALLLTPNSRPLLPFQGLALLAVLISWLGFSRYLYGGAPLVAYADMAVHTALLFLALSAGVLCTRTDGGLLALLVSRGLGGTACRRLLPVALIAPLAIGWLRLQGQRAGWYGTEAGLSLFALSNVLVFSALAWVTGAYLDRSDSERQRAEQRARAQLERLDLLQRITRAIGERQDQHSIFQVALRSLEADLQVAFACVCLHDPADAALSVASVGPASELLAPLLSMSARSTVAIDANGLSRCLQGRLVYEPDLRTMAFAFAQRLTQGGLHALVLAPLQVESRVFGMLVVARRQANSFSSGDCELLLQLSEHMALAAHQAQLHDALQTAYDDLRQTQQAAAQQDRLRALGQMASGIAHDINNALSPAALYTESLLERETSLSAQARGQLQTIERAIGDVSATVARMREFYRPHDAQPALMPLLLDQLVRQVVDLTRARWSDMPQRRGVVIELQTELAPQLPHVPGIESEIREALVNLVFNAVDAMPDGGRLTLRTRVDDPTETTAGAPPRTVCVDVIDTGIGMDEETSRRCLEPFFTTKGERGTGLGLAMVYGLVQRHGADLEIESAPGRGTTVSLRFPAANVATDPAQPASDPDVPPLRILIVDDDPVLLESLRGVLQADGHFIAGASGGRDGIAALHRGTAFDVVITDLGMPEVDGRRVAVAVKQASPSTPVLLLTGWGQRLIADAEVPPHVDVVLAKPPKLRELRAALARCSRGDANGR